MPRARSNPKHPTGFSRLEPPIGKVMMTKTDESNSAAESMIVRVGKAIARPYELRSGADLSVPPGFSASTNSMVTFALAVAMGGVRESILLPALRRPSPLITAFSITEMQEDKLRETFAQAIDALTEH